MHLAAQAACMLLGAIRACLGFPWWLVAGAMVLADSVLDLFREVMVKVGVDGIGQESDFCCRTVCGFRLFRLQ